MDKQIVINTFAEMMSAPLKIASDTIPHKSL